MKKTSTIKVAWDTLQAVNKRAWEESQKRKSKVTQDQMIRILVEEEKK